MAQSGTVVREKINSKVFNTTVATTINIYTVTKGDGNYGGFESTSKSESAPVEALGVPYGVITGDRNYLSMGFNSEGESLIAVRYDTTVNEDDYVEIPVISLKGKVIKVTEYPYGGVNLAKIITIKRQL
jgi:hypothetical protein